ncbi:M23 family metallopeptidase [Treponema saccharophilum]|uniref:Peptidase M23 n=1 Tax=Treponema saccharophilum DSM 2985 TaxID=907348 RepID=H7EH29_9SPIR|nr:M23 family metallopeptidase [Treponema saccharophilum]EIC03096.1 hypothetical protein TresaDRAFT_2714 [Treponema saccharophilum DSM 2985]BDC97345.1 hypothetical protein TRSA_24440 [Treponema saccharophilum]
MWTPALGRFRRSKNEKSFFIFFALFFSYNLFAEVLVVGKDVDFGNFIICQNLNNKKKFYILGHLKTISVNKNDILSPGSKLGKAGNTGKCYSKCGGVFKNSVRVENYPQYFNAGWGTHLHVQLVIVGALKDFYNSENGKITSSRCNSYNPFRHNDRWSE